MTEPTNEQRQPSEPEAPTAEVPTSESQGPEAHAPEPVAPAAVPAPAAGRDGLARVMGSSWLPPLATGLVGLMLGLTIGAVGMGLIAMAMSHHGPRGQFGPGDGRGHHWQDDRPAPPPRR